MSIPSTISFSASLNGASLSGITFSASGSSGTQIEVAVPASTTDQLYAIAIDISEVESLFLYTDGVLTLETNSSSAPDDTIVFAAASAPLIWGTGFPTVDAASQIPFDADVTAFYLTNATGSTVTLRGFINQSI